MTADDPPVAGTRSREPPRFPSAFFRAAGRRSVYPLTASSASTSTSSSSSFFSRDFGNPHASWASPPAIPPVATVPLMILISSPDSAPFSLVFPRPVSPRFGFPHWRGWHLCSWSHSRFLLPCSIMRVSLPPRLCLPFFGTLVGLLPLGLLLFTQKGP